MYLKFVIKTISLKHIDIINKLITSCEKRIKSLNCKGTDKYKIISEYKNLQTDLVQITADLHKQISHKKSFYPSMEDLNNQGNNILLKPNYKTVDEYLTYQKNIVREDFLIPFRKEFNIYRLNKFVEGYNEKNSCTFYRNVYIVEETFFRSKLCIVLDISSSSEFVRSKQHNAKHFMYGSLVVVTYNNFSTSFFATVEEGVDLTSGHIILSFCELYDIQEFYNKTLILMESYVYFEPYYNVLVALDEMDTNNFPMDEYIIKNTTTIKPPKYSTDIICYNYKGRELSILNTNLWPDCDSIGLNPSQMEAIKIALLNELVLIQGPPGTGKTFVAVEIATILLNNLSNQQILVVCYTNQALDNFLKSLTAVTQNIVRIGNQSTEPLLAKYHVSSRKHGKSNTMLTAFSQIKSEILDVLKEIKLYQTTLSMINSDKGIIRLDEKLACNWLPNSTNLLSPLSNWLLGSFKDNMSVPENLYQSQNTYQFNKIQSNENHNSEISEMIEKSLNDFKIDPELEFDVALDTLQKSLLKLDLQIEKISNNDEYLKELQEEREELKFWIKHLTFRMATKHIGQGINITNSKATDLNFDERWNLYWHWIDLVRKNYLTKSRECYVKYCSLLKQYEELTYIQYTKFLKDAKVIGMTTTSASKMQAVLKGLKIPIVIFEEAAEIPESHTIASLTNYCEHIIMIGDHKQLQPQNASFELSKKSNINISLFERLVNSGFLCHTLKQQYRMRPEISSLISPIIYEDLLNDNSVLKYPDIRGVSKNLYFITHNIMEDNRTSTSYSNNHEAKFLVKFCQYLLLNKYNTNDITILTTYSGQVCAIQNEIRKYAGLKYLETSTVDNFQGQEKRIILLSLVRSNKDANIGFMSKENRICVALSRAKEGLFIIGNMENFSRNNNTWQTINKVLEEQQAIGDYLPLTIQTKSNTLNFQVRSSEDFDLPLSHLS